MEYTIWVYLVLLAAGFLAGIINTLAGNGSILTITALSVAVGLPVGMANGTNRVGVTFQTLVGLRAFLKSGKTDFKGVWKIAIPTVIGSAFGAYVAVEVGKSNDIWLSRAIGGVMIFMLFLVLNNPKKWVEENKNRKELGLPWLFPIFLAVGFYGGFIQAGVGVIMLVVLMSVTSYNLTNANAVKLLLTLLLTIPAFTIFIWNGQVEWIAGLTLSVSQMLGAMWAAKFAIGHPKANYWIRAILIGIIIIAIIRFLGIYDFISEQIVSLL
ncbi:sulfite exporter TauE/SafE family protein [Bernardetia sp. ABR2-2B]|uniref:sulfite exporter TauE/SafE family protein n=1 Tax=Bernardetia sp. ABR2-2B TaxID=3127472 RepID=UPI0030CD4C47